MHIIALAEFEWDERKAISNLRKHGVAFADAVSAVETIRSLLQSPMILRRRTGS